MFDVLHSSRFTLVYPIGSIYFIDPINGNDFNIGSEISPWKTIKFALVGISGVVAGDTIILKEGIYRENDIKVTKSGIINKPITLKSINGDTAIIRGTSTITTKTNWTKTIGRINIYELSYSFIPVIITETNLSSWIGRERDVLDDGNGCHLKMILPIRYCKLTVGGPAYALISNALDEIDNTGSFGQDHSGLWTYDNVAHRLYIRPFDDIDPTDVELGIEIGIAKDGVFTIEPKNFYILDNLIFEHPASGPITLQNSIGTIMRNCLIIDGGLQIVTCTDCLLQDIRVTQSHIRNGDDPIQTENFKWHHDAGGQGASFKGGIGNIYERITIDRCWNGLDFESTGAKTTGLSGLTTIGVSGSTTGVHGLSIGWFVTVESGPQNRQTRKVISIESATTFILEFAFSVDQSNVTWTKTNPGILSNNILRDFIIWGCPNHLFSIGDGLRGALIERGIIYNGQDSLICDNAHDVVFSNCLFMETASIQGVCTNTKFQNCVHLSGYAVALDSQYGFDSDYTLFISNDRLVKWGNIDCLTLASVQSVSAQEMHSIRISGGQTSAGHYIPSNSITDGTQFINFIARDNILDNWHPAASFAGLSQGKNSENIGPY